MAYTHEHITGQHRTEIEPPEMSASNSDSARLKWLPWLLEKSAPVPRRKVFISYHHEDQWEVDRFIYSFGGSSGSFIHRGLGVLMADDIINSTDTDYVMRRIREQYLEDSIVTLVLIGRCTWARRYVDWELQASLRHGETVTPNGVIGVVLPSAANNATPPNRLALNLPTPNVLPGYARWYGYPQNPVDLQGWIEDAVSARSQRAHLIVNPRERFTYNRTCI